MVILTRCDQLSEAYSFAVIVWQMATRKVRPTLALTLAKCS